MSPQGQLRRFARRGDDFRSNRISGPAQTGRDARTLRPALLSSVNGKDDTASADCQRHLSRLPCEPRYGQGGSQPSKAARSPYKRCEGERPLEPASPCRSP